MKTFDLKPQLFDTLKSYNKKNFMSDLMAGIIVGIVALPLAIAFGIASGVTPEKGIITAIVAGFLVSLLGGSKVQIGGPTGAFIVIIYGIIQKYGIEGLTIATIMAGVFLILFGLLKLGTIIKYIPYPIVVGFTSGIAVTIFTTQIKDLFGAEVLGSGVMYVLNGKYNLRKLKSYDVLTLGEFAAEIKTVRVAAYTELKDGCRLSYSGFVNFALFDTMERDDSEIVSATFEFTFMGSDRKYKATISNAYRSKIQTGCDEELVERFFTSKGLIRDTSYEELEILVANGAKSPAL